MKSNRALLIGTVLGAAIIVLLVLVLMKQNRLIKMRSEQHAAMLSQQSKLIEAKRRSGLMPLMRSLMEQVNTEVETNPSRSLSEKLIKQLAILSDSFEAGHYSYVESDSLHSEDLIQERGQLLLFLISMDIDSGSFGQIKQNVSFAKADLEGAELAVLELSGINLMSAHLKNSDLRGANLKGANLKGANLWGSKLIGANLNNAALNRANLNWTIADSVEMQGADLSGAYLTNAKMRNANLSGIVAPYAFMRGAIFNESNLKGINLFMTDLSRADFMGADLSAADLREGSASETAFYEAIMDSVLFRNTRVHQENWFELLDIWKVKGRKKLRAKYKIVKDASGKANFSVVSIEN